MCLGCTCVGRVGIGGWALACRRKVRCRVPHPAPLISHVYVMSLRSSEPNDSPTFPPPNSQHCTFCLVLSHSLHDSVLHAVGPPPSGHAPHIPPRVRVPPASTSGGWVESR